MLIFLLKRIGSSILLLLVVSMLTFLLVYAGGQDVARTILGQYATEEQVLKKALELGLDRPLIAQYGDWLAHALTGDLGRSWFTAEPVVQALTNRLTVTFTIVVIVTICSGILAIVLGMLAAVRGGWIDRAVQVLGVLGMAIPAFVVALVLVSVFAVQLHWLPATGWTDFFDDPGLWAAGLVMPVAALLFATVAGTAQQIRGSLLDVLRRDFVRTLRARGLSEREILTRHVLRAASPPGLTVLALQFVGLVGGAVIVEQVFALPGIGYLAVQSTANGDMPMIIGVVLVTVVLVIVVNLVIDLLVGWLNPKARVA